MVRYDWVVGCDGSKSRVRKEAGIGFTGQRVGVMAMMDVEIEGLPCDDSWVNYFISRDLFMLVTKLPGRYWRVYLSDAGAMTKAGAPARVVPAGRRPDEHRHDARRAPMGNHSGRS